MRRPRCPASPARVADEICDLRAAGNVRVPYSTRSTSRPTWRASRRRCRAASRSCSRCIASRGRPTARSASTRRWSNSIPDNRAQALAYLSAGGADGFDAALIDNRLDAPATAGRATALTGTTDFGCDLGAATATLTPRTAPTIAIEACRSAIRRAATSSPASTSRSRRGRAYRLTGQNGAGKTTLFKLLAGVLAPSSGALSLDGAPYAPAPDGNRVFRVRDAEPGPSMVRRDAGRGCRAPPRRSARIGIAAPDERHIAALAARLGAPSLDAHLYELPLAARKRLSWLWPLSGTLPWIMLDEPTVGQDAATRDTLAAIARICALGYGADRRHRR